MRRTLVATLLSAALWAGTAPILGATEATLTGTGIAEPGPGAGPGAQPTAFGFEAVASGPLSELSHWSFPVSISVYPAEGSVDVSSAPGLDPVVAGLGLRGEVVCVADLGPARALEGSSGSADEDTDVWEVRAGFPDPGSGMTFYGSLFVQDTDAGDHATASFSAGLLFDPGCGKAGNFVLGPVTEGSIAIES